MFTGIWQELAEADYRRERIAADFGRLRSRERSGRGRGLRAVLPRRRGRHTG